MKHRLAPWRADRRVRAIGTATALAVGTTAVVLGGQLALRPGAVAAADAGTVPAAGQVAPPPAATEALAAVPTDAPAADPSAAPLPEPPVDVVRTYGVPPTSVTAPGTEVRADVVPVGVGPSGALLVPEDPSVLGWWSSGAAAGAASGHVVLVGHVDAASGVGVMRDVLDLAMGTTVEVTDETGATTPYRLV
ncbi:class F sortase, partial [Cellulomonas aerilata]